MTAPSRSTCEPWAEIDEACVPCRDYNLDAADLEEKIQIASDVLYELSGRQFPGECTETIRPCVRTHCRSSADPRGCGCSGLRQVRLRGLPVTEVTEVKVDGDVIPSNEYRVDDHAYLVRLPDPGGVRRGWPCCQAIDLADSERGTFSVTYKFGQPVPPAGRMAAATLGCELAMACDPEQAPKCRLPKSVTNVTRQGVSISVLNPNDFLEHGRIGIYEIDMFITAYNPGGGRGATVWSPDLDSARRTG